MATALFADVRGLTDLAARMAPEDVVTLLNQHLGPMVRYAMNEGGVVDKTVGDAPITVLTLAA